ncbi:MAG: hypothetical protein LBE78_13170 [Burkholderiaceae bacterium]|jgi:uncharacterized membrane protein YdjX (TVP38/TMEM64 family)|nr:hypothetical protein [Burkholderiaceae bacterium]
MDISPAAVLIVLAFAAISFVLGRRLSRDWRARRQAKEQAARRARETRQQRRARQRRQRG